MQPGNKLAPLERLQLAAMRLGLAFLRLLGHRGARSLGSALGLLLWRLAPGRRRYAAASVRRHLGLGPTEAGAVARRSFAHNLRSFLEAALVSGFRLRGNPLLRASGQYFEMLMREERPVVAVTAHIGGWELLAGLLADIGPGRPRAVIVRNQKNRAANELIFGMRGAGGGEIVGHRNAAPAITRILRQKGIVAFLVDHNALRDEAIFLPFLGETAAVNVGPATLALRSKAVVYPVFLIRREGGGYELVTRPPLDTGALEGSIAERTRRIAEFYTGEVEEIVRAHPEQWFWMHERWKTRPEGNGARPARPA